MTIRTPGNGRGAGRGSARDTSGTTTKRCPHDARPARHQTPKYPDALCFDCVDRATDDAGRPVSMHNEDFAGGFAALHRDDQTPCLGVMRTHRVRIDGVSFRAGEARFGGIVVRPVPNLEDAAHQ